MVSSDEPSTNSSLQPLAHIQQAYTRTLLQGDRLQAQKLTFEALRQGFGVRDIYLGVFQPSLYEIGRLWENGQLSIAQEHLATAITQSVLSAVYAQIDLPSNLEKHAIVACLSGNYHEIGPRMFADFLQMAGYNTRFLGANTPTDGVLEMIDSLKPDVVGLPATTFEQVEPVRQAIERLRADFMSYRPIVIVGGLAFNTVDGLWKTVSADLWNKDAARVVDSLIGSSGWG